MRMGRGILVAATVATAFVITGADAASAARTIRVPADYPTIQQALTASASGDVIVVAPGRYVGALWFGGKAVELRSEQGPAVTTIDAGDGTATGMIAPNAVTFDRGEGRSSVLRGFTITGLVQHSAIGIDGMSPTIVGNVITATGWCGNLGTAISVQMGSPLIQGNVIRGNQLSRGCSGTAYAVWVGAGGDTVRPVLIGNTIEDNYGENGIRGRGLFVGNASALVQNNTIRRNNGGGIELYDNRATIVHNLIVDNTAHQGGGIYWHISQNDPTPLLLHNTVVRNNATDGDAVYANGFDRGVVSEGNVYAGVDSAAVRCTSDFDATPPVFRSNLVHTPGMNGFSGCGALPAGNQTAAPVFVNAAAGDFRPAAGAPMVDRGPSTTNPALPVTDLRGETRVLDGNGDGTGVVDIGAFEHRRASAPVLPNVDLGDVVVGEGGGSAAVPIRLDRAGTSAVTVQLQTAAGTATTPTDFTSTSAAVTIPAGATSGVVRVPVVADALDENDETFQVRATSATGATVRDGVAVVTIDDDDPQAVISIADARVTEVDSGGTVNAVFTISIDRVSGRTVRVTARVATGTASASDVEVVAATIRIPAGVRTATMPVVVFGDNLDEANETFTVTISEPGAVQIGRAVATGTIVDDD